MAARQRVRLILPAFVFALFTLLASAMGHADIACDHDGYCGQLSPGGIPTAAAWLDDERMYVADYDGSIRLLNVDSGELSTVLAGLIIPQGLTVLDGRLYVTDMGNVCHALQDDDPWRCSGADIRNRTDEERVKFMQTSGARILSFRIDRQGNLSDRQVIEDRILSDSRDHSANGLTNDGEWVYVSIGHPEHTVVAESWFVENAVRFQGRDDLMGTIARFRPADEELRIEVYARGFRNVYGISIAPDGTLYGADNDDGSNRQKEELNAIVEGGNYGFPAFGTGEAGPEHGVTEPVAVLAGAGSTVAFATKYGVYVAYIHHTRQGVIDRFDYRTFTPSRFFQGRGLGYVPAILERDELLYLVDLSGGVIHIVEQRDGAIGSREPIPAWASRWAADGALARATYRAAVAGEPAVRSTFDVYVDGATLIYVKEPCAAEDMKAPFFLHVHPSDPLDLPADIRQMKSTFVNVDVLFLDHGEILDQQCVAAAALPDYQIARIHTGQYLPGEGALWSADLPATVGVIELYGNQ